MNTLTSKLPNIAQVELSKWSTLPYCSFKNIFTRCIRLRYWPFLHTFLEYSTNNIPCDLIGILCRHKSSVPIASEDSLNSFWRLYSPGLLLTTVPPSATSYLLEPPKASVLIYTRRTFKVPSCSALSLKLVFSISEASNGKMGDLLQRISLLFVL